MKKNNIIKLLSFLLIISLLMFGCSSENEDGDDTANAEIDYPDGPVDMIIPLSAGGAGDNFSRQFSKSAEEYLGDNIVSENKPGGSGAVAVEHALNEEADGQTLFYHSSSLSFLLASGQAPFEKEDLEAISILGADYQMLTVPIDSPYDSFEDFVEGAEDNPGKLTVSGSGKYQTQHALYLKMIEDAGIEAEYIPYDDSSEAVVAVLGGEVDALLSSGSGANEYVEGDEMKGLAVTGEERTEDHPDTPTFQELGLESIKDDYIWRGFFAKKGLPDEVKEKLNDVVLDVREDSEWQEYMENEKQMDFYMDPEESTEYFYEEVEEGKELFEDVD